MQQATLGKSDYEAALQLQSQIAREFSSEMTTAIQYILATAQSLGIQDYYKSLE